MTQYIKAANIPNMAALTYTINNLSPYTIYEMQLITSNGVSDQDTADVFFRTVTFSCKTAEGGNLLVCIHTNEINISSHSCSYFSSW